MHKSHLFQYFFIGAFLIPTWIQNFKFFIILVNYKATWFVNEIGKMSILKFFKPLEKPLVTPSDELTNKVLLDPKGPLTKVLLSSAIKMVNDEVLKVYQKTSFSLGSSPVESISNKWGKYLTLTLAQQFEVGKRAAEHGVTTALRYFEKKYPDLALKETSVKKNWRCEVMKLRQQLQKSRK